MGRVPNPGAGASEKSGGAGDGVRVVGRLRSSSHMILKVEGVVGK